MLSRFGILLPVLFAGVAFAQEAAPTPEAEVPEAAAPEAPAEEGDPDDEARDWADDDASPSEWRSTSRPTDEKQAKKKEARIRLRRGLYSWKLEDEDDAFRDWRRARELSTYSTRGCEPMRCAARQAWLSSLDRKIERPRGPPTCPWLR